MELRQYANTLLKWWWLIVASVVVSSISSYLSTRATPPTYQSHTTLMVGQALQNPNPSQSEFYTGQALARSYADLARREPVLKATLEALGLKWNWTVLQGMVSSRVVPNTQLLEISVQDTNPQRAKILADEIANQLILRSPTATDPQEEADRQFILAQIETLKTNIETGQDEMRQLDEVIAEAKSAQQLQDARDRQVVLQTQISTWQATYAQLRANLQEEALNFLSVVEPAQVSSQPIGPSTKYIVLLAVAVGVGLSGGAAFLLEYLDDTIKTPDDVRQALGVITLGSIPRIRGNKHSSKLIVAEQPRSSIAAAYRVLRTNLQFSAVDRPLRTLLVTSPSPQDGKSVTAANLAVAIARSGQRVILVDADLWRPIQHHIFELNNDVGLTTVLRGGDLAPDGALQAGPVENLNILPSGPLPPSPPDLLNSTHMKDLIEALRQQADAIVFDSPPVMVGADATILAVHMDGVLLIVDCGHTRRPLAQSSKEALEAVGARLSGVALNRVSTRREGYYYSGYYSDSQRSARNPFARFLKRNK